MGCFKKEIHTEKHTNTEENTEEDTKAASNDTNTTTEVTTKLPSIYDPLINDEIIQKLLSFKSTKTHLKHIATLLKDSKLAREATEEGRMEIANLGLLELRAGGENENEAIEEFCQRAMELLEQQA